MLHYTKEELAVVQKKSLGELVVVATTMSHLAKMLGVQLTTVQGWVARGRISKTGALRVEMNTSLNKQFTAIDLRPDL